MLLSWKNSLFAGLSRIRGKLLYPNTTFVCIRLKNLQSIAHYAHHGVIPNYIFWEECVSLKGNRVVTIGTKNYSILLGCWASTDCVNHVMDISCIIHDSDSPLHNVGQLEYNMVKESPAADL